MKQIDNKELCIGYMCRMDGADRDLVERLYNALPKSAWAMLTVIFLRDTLRKANCPDNFRNVLLAIESTREGLEQALRAIESTEQTEQK